MTKKDLIELLDKYDDDTKVYIYDYGTEMYISELEDRNLQYSDGCLYIKT